MDTVLKSRLNQLFNNHNYKLVIGIYEENAVDLFTEADVLLMVAAAYLKIGAVGDSIILSEKIVAVHKKFFLAYLLLSQSYYAKLCYVEAEKVLIEMMDLYEADISRSIKKDVYNFLGTIYRETGNVDESSQCFLKSNQFSDSIDEKAISYSNYLLTLNYQSENDSLFIYNEHKKFANFFKSISCYQHQVRTKDKLNIGYISPDFRHHIVMSFSYCFFAAYNKEKFNVIGYANCSEDDVSKQVKEMAVHWRNINGMPANEAAALIYEDEIDILVDLSGHTANNCLPILAYRPAPIQISGIGYMNTTGLDAVDYFFTDSSVDPAGINDTYFTEKLLRLPDSHFCYTANREVPTCALPAFLNNQYTTFGTFNSVAKITDGMLALWKSIMDKVKNSKLILKDKIFGNPDNCEIFYRRLQKVGFDIQQVELRPFSLDYMKQYGDIDIALDTYPYVGGGTTFEALYMGIPVITLVGQRHGARFGYGILKTINLSECIAFNGTDYIQKAVDLANNPAALIKLHANLRERMVHSPLMAGRQYVQAIEKLYRSIWNQWVNNKMEENGFITSSVSGTDKSCLKTRLKQLGNFHTQQGQYYKVLECVGHLLELDVYDYQSYYMGAAAYLKLDDFYNALILAKKTISLKPDDIGAYMIMAFCYNKMLLIEEEIVILKKIIALAANIKNRNQYDFTGQAWCLLSGEYLLLGDNQQAKAGYLQLCKVLAGDVNKSTAYSSYLMCLHYDDKVNVAEMLSAHKKYNEFFLDIKPYEHFKIKKAGKLKIGYISPDFRQHAVAFFCYALFTQYNSETFEIFCYSRGEVDATTLQLQNLVPNWRDIEKISYCDAAELIYKDNIDILVDLSGHTANNCLPILAYKPAPIQLCGIGYFNTTGLSTVDYFITDQYVDPVGMNDSVFSERLLRLPHSHFCYMPRSDAPDCDQRTFKNNGLIRFCVFNNFAKVTDEMLDVWLKILQQVPNSILVFKSKLFGSDYGCRQVSQRLLRLGYDLKQVEFRKFTGNHMQEYLDMDIALDTFPYPGGVTTCEALFMGVPVITLVGQRHGSRFGYSILKNTGFEEGIAYTEAEYIERAVYLANHPMQLNTLHKTLRGNMIQSDLMNDRQYTAELESKYQQIWSEFIAENKVKQVMTQVLPFLRRMAKS